MHDWGRNELRKRPVQRELRRSAGRRRHGRPYAIAVDAGGVYWTEGADDKNENTGRLMKASLDANAAPTTLAEHLHEPADLAVDATSV